MSFNAVSLSAPHTFEFRLLVSHFRLLPSFNFQFPLLILCRQVHRMLSSGPSDLRPHVSGSCKARLLKRVLCPPDGVVGRPVLPPKNKSPRRITARAGGFSYATFAAARFPLP